MNAFEIRFGRHGLHYMIFFGSMYFWAAVSKDVVLGWSLTVARFSIGILHLLAVFGDHSMSKAFLAFAIPDIITALLAARWLPSYKKAFPKRCRSPDLKSAHILLAFISIMTAVLHITGTIQFNQIYSLISRQISFGAFPVIPNSGYALSPQVRSSSLYWSRDCRGGNCRGLPAQVGPLPDARDPGPRPDAPARRPRRRRRPGAQARRRPLPHRRPRPARGPRRRLSRPRLPGPPRRRAAPPAHPMAPCEHCAYRLQADLPSVLQTLCVCVCVRARARVCVCV